MQENAAAFQGALPGIPGLVWHRDGDRDWGGLYTCGGLAPLTGPQLRPFQELPSLTGNNCVAVHGSQTET